MEERVIVMTEKRFWVVPLDYYGEQRFVRDNSLVGEKSLSNDEVVELLNMLHEENILLEQSKMEMANSLGRAIDENEQLKKELKNLRKLVNEMYMEGSE